MRLVHVDTAALGRHLDVLQLMESGIEGLVPELLGRLAGVTASFAAEVREREREVERIRSDDRYRDDPEAAWPALERAQRRLEAAKTRQRRAETEASDLENAAHLVAEILLWSGRAHFVLTTGLHLLSGYDDVVGQVVAAVAAGGVLPAPAVTLGGAAAAGAHGLAAAASTVVGAAVSGAAAAVAGVVGPVPGILSAPG
jgi:hypothetical protein